MSVLFIIQLPIDNSENRRFRRSARVILISHILRFQSWKPVYCVVHMYVKFLLELLDRESIGKSLTF